ncbi:MAG: membrane dipeptidase [Planctomycetaceae bacterium]|nr:MAG: membrane dipeptidase [bacterium]MCE7927544.1 membrane dipeptidase [Chloroflexi bacterium CFX7]MCK6563555.1 dipeptidase [Dehalococcoidia bacterium]NUN51395.1 membrane dipeptidase [Planctomycetaceae bacterium]MCL4232533.1 dipeptidase [Dehalococcoidia bacterium]
MTVTLNREFPPIFDGHEDFITQVRMRTPGFPPKPPRDFLTESNDGQVDLPRARRGGLGGCFTSIYLTDERAEMNAVGYAMREMDDVFTLADRSAGQFRVCRTVAEVRDAFVAGAFASVFMFEGADPISWSLKELRVFYEAGLRCLAPAWSRSTIFAHGVSFGDALPETGLTLSGRRLVAECNRLGIILDASHINPAGFWDLIAESRYPIIASHSCVKAISPHVRNLDDDQIRAIAEKGGTIGINFANIFLRPDMKRDASTPVDLIAQHFDHILNLVGDEHVSFGTDFDGTDVPDAIRDATGLPLVCRALKERGYAESSLERICNGNFLRVAEDVWK